MLYHLYELQHALLTPARLTAELTKSIYRHPWNFMSHTQAGRTVAASAEMFERMTRRFGKPDFHIDHTTIDGHRVEVAEEEVVEKPFCTLLHFRRHTTRKDPRVLIVAPMSGHYASLLRGTVEALLPHHDVYITDWEDTRMVPLKKGRFNLDDYITYLREFLSLLGPNTHVIAVCQPAVPVFAAVCLMEAENDPNRPATMTLMGGPIDTRISKTKVTELAETRPLEWFEKSVVYEVPFYHPGAGRKVYPGFLQLGGFMSMNLDRHVGSHMKFYQHLISGDGESADKHREFYNEYLSVMDISGDFYLQTVDTVFQRHLLPKGKMKWRDPLSNELVDVLPDAVKRTALLTIEGELDDISAHGQTTAAHEICVNLPKGKQFHHFQMDCGHYGIFNGRRWRQHIMPRIRSFIREFDGKADAIPKKDLEKSPEIMPNQWDKSTHGIDAVRKRLLNKEKEKPSSEKVLASSEF